MKKIAFLSLAVCVAGCTTGYQKHTWTGGYKDTDLGGGKHAVEYLGNGTTNPQLVLARWHQRASELCPSGYTVLAIKDGANTLTTGALVGAAIVPISSTHPWVKGQVQCK